MPDSLLTDNVRIKAVKPLVPPAILLEDVPASETALKVIRQSRVDIEKAITGDDDRLVCIVGPCSIHDVDAAKHYARRLKTLADQHKDDLLIVIRTYFEKPRTVGGWKGLVYDPELDGTHKINKGLRMARELLAYLAELGLPTACEMLDNITPQYTSDLVSWVAIGARTTESQIHRQVASGSSMPIGFKNGTSGESATCIDAVRSAGQSHWFPSVTKQGVTAIFQTEGNDAAHVILRGGTNTGPNFDEESVTKVSESLIGHGLPGRVMIDCSHGNSGKDYKKQSVVADEVCRQLASGSDRVFGVMIESFLKEGRQDSSDLQALEYGLSITDSCISIEQTEEMMNQFAKAVQARRKAQ
jgi:3-deoxy-7-phosphoheptulonate synthase